MGMTETALLGIACLMTNAPPAEQEALMRSFTVQERAAVDEMKKLCVPDKLKELLRAGREELGNVSDARAEQQPTLRC